MGTQSNHPGRGAVAVAVADGASKPRRRFLGALVASIGSPLLAIVTPLRARNSTARLHLQDCRIAGSHYYDCHKVLAHLRAGDALRLRRQTDNLTTHAPSKSSGASTSSGIYRASTTLPLPCWPTARMRCVPKLSASMIRVRNGSR